MSTFCKENYAKTQGERPFNWKRFLLKKRYTWDDLDNAYWRATDWVTCACGNQCSIIPRGVQYGWSSFQPAAPVDSRLRRDGLSFATHIENMAHYRNSPSFEGHRILAQRCLHRIERRSAYLIAKILKKQKS